MSAQRVTNLYDLMDAAYCSAELREHSRSLGHVPNGVAEFLKRSPPIMRTGTGFHSHHARRQLREKFRHFGAARICEP